MQNKISNGWQKVKLNEVVEFVDGDRGVNYPNNSELLNSGHCLFLNTKNVPSTDFNFSSSDNQFISREKDIRLRKGKLKRGDFVLTTRGTVGNFAYYSDSIPYENIRINSGMVILRNSIGNLDSGFLKQFLNSSRFRTQVLSLTSGSAQPQLPIRDLSQLMLELPPFSYQKKISAVLSAYENKIEINNKIAKTLEEMAQVIFNKKMVGAVGKKYSFSSLAIYINGGAFGKIINNESRGLPLIKIADLNRGITDNTEYVDKTVPDRYYIQDGDLLFSWSGSLDLYIWGNGKAVLNQHIFNVIPKNNFSKGFLYFVLMWKLRYFKQIAGSKATTMGHIKKEHLQEQSIVIPDDINLNIFDIVYKKLVQLKLENQKIVSLRDLLLPKLMKGEIRV